MKYSSFRLMMGFINLGMGPLMGFIAAMIFMYRDDISFPGSRVAVLAVFLIVASIVISALAEIKMRKRYPQYDEDEERYRIYRVAAVVVCTILEFAMIFAFDFYNFPLLFFMFWRMISVVDAAYNFRLYYRAKRSETGEWGGREKKGDEKKAV